MLSRVKSPDQFNIFLNFLGYEFAGITGMVQGGIVYAVIFNTDKKTVATAMQYMTKKKTSKAMIVECDATSVYDPNETSPFHSFWESCIDKFEKEIVVEVVGNE